MICAQSNRVFHKLDEIGTNANIGIRGFTMGKQKNPKVKFYPQWGQNLGLSWTSDSKSNTLLSELSGHVLLRGSLNFCSCITWFLDLDHSCSKASDVNIGIIANVMCLWKTRIVLHCDDQSGNMIRLIALPYTIHAWIEVFVNHTTLTMLTYLSTFCFNLGEIICYFGTRVYV